MAIVKGLKTAGRWALELLALIAVGFVAAFLFLVAFAPSALAAGPSARVSWTLPTTLIDGSALPANLLKETLIEWRRTAAGPLVGSLRVAAPAASVDVPGLVCGDFVFVAYAITTANDSSSASNTAPYQTGVKCVPNPPTGVGAQ